MSFFQDVINIVAKYYPQLLSGVGNTMLIALTGTVAGLVIGLLTGIVRTAPFSRNGFVRALHRILNAVIAVYVEIFRGTPMMVQALIFYYAGFGIFKSTGMTVTEINQVWSFFISGLMTVSLNSTAYLAEVLRGGIESIDHGQTEAARSLGMSNWQTMLKVVFPQAVKNSISRGKVDVFVSIRSESASDVNITLNTAMVEGYLAAMTRMVQDYGVRDDISVSTLARMSDVFTVERAEVDEQQLQADLMTVADKALKSYDAMRAAEGKALENDLRSRGETILSLVEQVEAGVPYLVYPTAGYGDKGYYEFTDVTRFVATPQAVTQSQVSYTPSFVSTTAPQGAYVLSQNVVYHLTSAMAMKGFRAYFVENSAAAKISTWSLDGVVTGIEEIDMQEAQPFDVYNMNGQKVRANATSLDGLSNGVYIVNGKKVVKK